MQTVSSVILENDVLILVALSLDRKPWIFIDGKDKIKCEITDESFWAKLQEGKTPLFPEAVFIVDKLIVKEVVKNGDELNFTYKYEIVKVKDIKIPSLYLNDLNYNCDSLSSLSTEEVLASSLSEIRGDQTDEEQKTWNNYITPAHSK